MEILKQKFEEFKNIEGDIQSKLRRTGFVYSSPIQSQIETFEQFCKVVSAPDCLNRENVKNQLKKIYRNHIDNTEMQKLLKMGIMPFNVAEIEDSKRILPLNEDGSISVDDMVDFLFK